MSAADSGSDSGNDSVMVHKGNVCRDVASRHAGKRDYMEFCCLPVVGVRVAAGRRCLRGQYETRRGV
jgi:hypothetical protein